MAGLQQHLEGRYAVKTQILGPNAGKLQEVKIRNCIAGWSAENGLKYEAEPRHTEIIIDQLIFKDAYQVATPGTNDKGVPSRIAELT